MNSKPLSGKMITVASSLALLVCSVAANAGPPVSLPEPEPGSFFTAFDYASDGRLIAFDGFTVYIQQDPDSATFTTLGTLPEAYRGATDPGFVAVSPNGNTLLLSAGAGGAQFPDPAFNGNLFELPISGGEATLIGTYPFIGVGEFLGNGRVVFGQSQTTVGSVEALNLNTLAKQTLIGNIPGDPGGVAFDGQGNLYVGLGSSPTAARAGEIHKFSNAALLGALVTGTPLDFDTDSTIIADILNAGDLEFDAQGHLFVGGSDFAGGPAGFVAEVNVATGTIINRYDPTDGDPNDGDARFFDVAVAPGGCEVGILDLLSFFNADAPSVFEQSACGP